VVGRHVFYNHSAFDGHNAAPTPGDDAAIAIDKAPLLPGHSATFANVTSYTRGINGVMIDVSAGLPMTALAGIAGSLGLKAGAAGDPATWPDAPRPSQIGIRAGAGVGGSDRITLVWPDGAIRNTWLRVTVRASPHSGLAADDVFTFGNLVGETGDGGALGVSTRDALDARSHRSARGVSIDSDYDHDRDGTVGVLDYSAALRNLGRSLTLASPPPAAAPAGAPSDVRRAPTRRTLLDAGVRDEGRA